MAIPLAAMFATSALQGILGGRAKRKLMKRQNEAAFQANQRNLIQNADTISSLNLQASQLRQSAAVQRFQANREADKAQGTAEAQAAAAGVKGASVDAQAQLLEKRADEVDATILYNTEVQTNNVTQQITQQVYSTLANFNYGAGKAPSNSSIIGAAFINAGIQTASSYFSFKTP